MATKRKPRTLSTPQDLTPDTKNANKGTDRGADLIRQSLEDYGAGRSIVVDRDGNVIAGNKTLEQAIALGLPIHTITSNGKELVVVQRTDLEIDSPEGRGLAYMDNRAGELSLEWDIAQIMADQEAGLIPDNTFLQDELDYLAELEGGGEGGKHLNTDPDFAPAVRPESITELGDLWLLGKHRVFCGDATRGSSYARLFDDKFRANMVFTDPPYGVAVGEKNKWLDSLDRGSSNRVTENLKNDQLPEDQLLQMLRSTFRHAIDPHVLEPGASWYVCGPAGPLQIVFMQALNELGIFRQTIQWVKNNATFSPMGVSYHWQCEPIFYGWTPNAGHQWYGDRSQTTAWHIDRPSKSPEHPTMKPVELVEKAIRNSGMPGSVVLDMFLGSGTTIIACELTGHECRGFELDPHYCDVIVRRWQEATGEIAENKTRPGVVITD